MNMQEDGNRSPRLSIITVNRNDRDGLARTLRSVHEEQSFENREHIVIDGASDDGSLDTIRAYESRLTRWVSEPDEGIYQAMNKGIRLASGEYLLFLNAGDWLAADVLEEVFRDFPDADIVYGNVQFYRDGHPTDLWIPPGPEALNFVFWIRGSLPHCSAFIRRRLLVPAGYREDLRVMADREFYFRMHQQGRAAFAHLDRVITCFSRGGISNDPRFAELRYREAERVFQPHIRPLSLARLLGRPTEQEEAYAFLVRKRHALIRENRTVRTRLRRWIDLFFLLQRFALTRAVTAGWDRILQGWERRRPPPAATRVSSP